MKPEFIYNTWVNQVKRGMTDKIYSHFTPLFEGPVRIHTEEQEQAFTRPAFFVFYGYISEYPSGLRGEKRRRLSMRVRYHPSEKHGMTYDEISAVADELDYALNEIEVPRLTTAEPEDRVIVRKTDSHYVPSDNHDYLMYDVIYNIYLYEPEEEMELMEELELNKNVNGG